MMKKTARNMWFISSRYFFKLSNTYLPLFLFLGSTGSAFSQSPKQYQPDSHTLLLCHFDKSAYADYSRGSSSPSGDDVSIVRGKWGKGLLINKGEKVFYKGNDGNIDLQQGTIEFYIKPNWNGNDGEYRQLFSMHGSPRNWIMISKFGVKEGKSNNKLGGAICSQRPDEKKHNYASFAYDISSWKKGEWHHLALTWQNGEDAVFYIDHKEVARRKKISSPRLTADQLLLGRMNCNAAIDEFRISDIPRKFNIIDRKGTKYLSNLEPVRSIQDFGALGRDSFLAIAGKIPIGVGGYTYEKGLATHANAEITYKLDGKYDKFKALIGIDNYVMGTPASVIFEVYGDGKNLFRSKLFTPETKPEEIEVPISGINELKLVLSDGGNGHNCDLGDWIDAMVLEKGVQPPPPSKRGRCPKPVKTEKKAAQKVSVSNLYAYNFSIPFSNKGYALAGKNYLDEINQDAALPVTEKVKLSCFATPGEYEPLSFVIYAEKDLSDIEIKCSDLKNKAGTISNKNIAVRYGMRVPVRRRYSWPVSKGTVPVTRFLRSFEKLNIPKQNFREIYLTIKVPEGTDAGKYYGEISISPKNGKKSNIDLELEVLPFKLKMPPNKRYGIYYHLSHRFITPKRLARELRDMKEHQISILYPRLSVRYDTVSLEPDYSKIIKGLTLLRNNDFKGRVILGTGLHQLSLISGYDKKDPEAIKKLEKNKKFWEIAKKTIAGFKDIQKQYPEFEIVLTHLDEITDRNRLPLYILLTKAAKQVPGFKYFISLDNGTEKRERVITKADPYVEIRNYLLYMFEWWLARGHTFEELEKDLKRTGDEADFYVNPVGPYYTPEWYRIVNGLYLWISPFSAHMPWIYYDIRGDAFNDLDGKTSDHIFAFYSEKDNDIVNTKIWEGWREGVDDIRYIYTLENLIEKNKNKENKFEVIKDAEAWLKNIKSMLPKPPQLPYAKDGPWRGLGRKTLGTPEESPFVNAISNQLTFEDYQHIRRKTADFIMKLQDN
ncbi:MAG: DUF6067 family protein [Victivallaceae bacterium]|nr:DUF6067 family protein [Victivallaceae bacterium]